MADRPTWVGKTLGGRYRIDDILGQGGMSAVYKAYDPNLKRVVAVKIIHGHLADDQRFMARFEEEATAVAQLRHPNIVQVFDFDHDGDLYYMVQEFIPGETLQQLLRRLERSGRRMPLGDVIRYTVHIANASGYAHQRGMIHRDIKPANIMIDVHGQATLMDFGIVKITGGERHTATGAVVGTALYLSPELIRGEVPDPRSDVYALGVTLFEMVSGRPPYEADSAMTLMMMHLNDPLPDLRQLRHGVPDALVAVIEKAMQKNRPDRYASMDEMAADLQAALQTLPASPDVTQVEAAPVKSEPTSPTAALRDTGTQVEVTPEPEPVAETPPPSPAAPPAQMPVSQPPTLDSPSIVTPPEQVASAELGTQAMPAVEPSVTPSPGADETLPPVERGAGGPPAPPPTATSAPSAGKKPLPMAVWVGVGLVVVILVIFGIIQASRGGSQPSQALEPAASATPTTAVVVAAAPTDTLAPTETAAPSATATLAPTDTPSPTPTPTLGLPPTPTFPAGIPFAFIKSITLDEGLNYIVDYDTLEFQEKLPGVHVHFFFNTVLPEQAGNPGSGPWILWGGPRPFDKYRQRDHNEQATQMCVLVANADHSVQPESGNCAILPDVNAVTILTETACLAGTDVSSQVVTSLPLGQVARVLGISTDGAWWNIANPEDMAANCWVPGDLAFFHGDQASVPVVEPVD